VVASRTFTVRGRADSGMYRSMSPDSTRSGLGRLQLNLDPAPDAPASARRALRSLPLGERADDVLLLASELVTNAVVHAETGGPIELTAECRPDATWVEVRDHGPGFASPHPVPRHGLNIVSATSERWGIVQDGATSVWFEVC
jgi:two-component sensor histidine kinase